MERKLVLQKLNLVLVRWFCTERQMLNIKRGHKHIQMHLTVCVREIAHSFPPSSLVNKIKPGIIKSINRLSTPTVGLVSFCFFIAFFK